MDVVSIIGRSGVGKTTLIERLIPTLRDRGRSVAALKYSHHRAIQLDREGKDSDRFARAGADAVVLVAPDRVFQVSQVDQVPSVDEVLRSLLVPVELVLVESWRSARLPCIELVGQNGERADPSLRGELIAVVGPGRSFASDVPFLHRDDVEGVANVIERRRSS